MKQYFHAAFSFLTILAKGKEYSHAAMQKSIYCYPFVGAVGFFFCAGKRDEEFRKILKDSRIGSFGALALIFYFLFGMTLISQILEINITQKNYWSFMEEMIFVGFWSRLGLLALPFCSQIYEPQNQEFSLSKILFDILYYT